MPASESHVQPVPQAALGRDRGDAHDAWGRSTWFFECDRDGYPVRQIERYDEGPTLRYDVENPEDEFGGLTQTALDADGGDWDRRRISEDEFEEAWSGR